MRRIFSLLLPCLLAGLIIAATSTTTRGSQTGPPSKKIKGVHGQEAQSQRSRLKQSRKSTRAEARSVHHARAPKAGRHTVRKVQHNANPQNPELRGARRQNRSRKKSPHQSQTN